GAAHAVLDEAFLVVRASGIDALAALICQAVNEPTAGKIDEPARQVAADEGAVARLRDPPRDEAEADRVLAAEPRARHGLLEIEQAEIVLAPLAHDDLARL